MNESTPKSPVRKTSRRFKIGVLLRVSDEEMRDLYLRQELTQQAIGTIYGVTAATVRFDLMRRGIPIRSLSESRAIVLRRPEFHVKLSMSKMGNTSRIGQKHTAETREKQAIPKRGKQISEETRQKMRDVHLGQIGPRTGFPCAVGAGRTKWLAYKRFNGIEIKVQGPWELNVAKYLDSVDEQWEYVGHCKSHSFLLDGGRRYFADFYLTRLDLYIDPKSFVWPKQRPKYEEVERLYPGRVIFMVGKTYMEQLKKLLAEFRNPDGILEPTGGAA